MEKIVKLREGTLVYNYGTLEVHLRDQCVGLAMTLREAVVVAFGEDHTIPDCRLV
jgi:hypothetical protein